MNSGYTHVFKTKNNGDVSCTGTLSAGNTNITGSIQCSGNLQTGYTVAIKGTSGGDVATLYLATPLASGSAYKCAIVAEGMNTWSRRYFLGEFAFCFIFGKHP